jgi:hypothetical protein
LKAEEGLPGLYVVSEMAKHAAICEPHLERNRVHTPELGAIYPSTTTDDES